MTSLPVEELTWASPYFTRHGHPVTSTKELAQYVDTNTVQSNEVWYDKDTRTMHMGNTTIDMSEGLNYATNDIDQKKRELQDAMSAIAKVPAVIISNHISDPGGCVEIIALLNAVKETLEQSQQGIRDEKQRRKQQESKETTSSPG